MDDKVKEQVQDLINLLPVRVYEQWDRRKLYDRIHGAISVAMANGYAIAKLDEEALAAEKVKTAGLELTVSRLRTDLQATKDLLELERVRFSESEQAKREAAVAARETWVKGEEDRVKKYETDVARRVTAAESQVTYKQGTIDNLTNQLVAAKAALVKQRSGVSHALTELISRSFIAQLFLKRDLTEIAATLNNGGYEK